MNYVQVVTFLIQVCYLNKGIYTFLYFLWRRHSWRLERFFAHKKVDFAYKRIMEDHTEQISGEFPVLILFISLFLIFIRNNEDVVQLKWGDGELERLLVLKF